MIVCPRQSLGLESFYSLLSPVYSLFSCLLSIGLWPMEAVSWTRNRAKIVSCFGLDATKQRGSFRHILADCGNREAVKIPSKFGSNPCSVRLSRQQRVRELVPWLSKNLQAIRLLPLSESPCMNRGIERQNRAEYWPSCGRAVRRSLQPTAADISLRAYPITQNPNELAAPVSPVVVESW